MENIPQDVLHSTYQSALIDGPAEFLRSVANDFRDRADKERALKRKAWQSRSKELDSVDGHLTAYAEQLAAFIVNNPDGVTLVDDDADQRVAAGGPAGAEEPSAIPAPLCGDWIGDIAGKCTLYAGHGGSFHANVRTRKGVDIYQAWPIGTGIRPVSTFSTALERSEWIAVNQPLPGNTGRCASFRRADPDDQTVCGLERGHEGQHGTKTDDPLGFITWPRKHTGHVCGDVVVMPDGTALNCARELGHDGTEHHDGRYLFWPRGQGTSRLVRVCDDCNRDQHVCHGCGEPIGHFAGDCGKGCTDDPPTEITDAKITSISLGPDGITTHITAQTPDGPAKIAFTDPNPQVIVPPCGDPHDIDSESTSAQDSCMLPSKHTGKHIGYTGARWEQVAATLGEQAEQQRQAMIPGQRAESDGPVTVSVMTPAAHMVAEMKEEVSATVEGLSNPFAQPPAAPSYATMTISGSTEPEEPAVPRAEFLPPHLVPGAPRERYSVSSVDAMADCGLKFRLKYRDGVAATNISWAGVGGKAFHEVVRIIECEHAERTAQWGPDAPLLDQERSAATLWKQCFADQIAQEEESSGIPSERWRATNGGREDRAWWLHAGEDMVRKYIQWRPGFLAEGWTLLRTPAGAPAQEIEFDVAVGGPGGVMNKGFIDAAWVNQDKGTIRIVDYKSGTSDNKPFQLKTYGHALRALGALDGWKVEGAFYDARKAQWSGAPLTLSADDDAEVEYRFQSTAAADRAGIFLARPSSFCGGCEVKASCPIMAKKG